MENHKATRKWSELYNLTVYVPGLGKSLGKVEDFFFRADSNAVYALSVRTRLHGDLTLPVTGIKAVETDRITVPNEQVLTRAVPAHLRGQSMLSRKVVDGKEHELGGIKDLLLAVEPALTMRVVGIEVSKNNSEHTRSFSTDGVTSYADDVVTVDDYTAKKF